MIVLVGPTASGKTELAIGLARALDGEIISADSRQVYRELSAGTAKPRLDAQGRTEGVPCHLVDCLAPTERLDAGRWAQAARDAVATVRGRGRAPIVAGGTGLYVRALLEGLADLPPRDEAARRRLEARAAAEGRAALHESLRAVDPEAAAAIPANNLQRVIRALEVFELTGEPISRHWTRHQQWKSDARNDPSPNGTDAPRGEASGFRRPAGVGMPLVIRIEWSNDQLRERIAARAEAMWPRMLEEVASLLQRYSGREPGFESLGYPEAAACVRGEIGSAEGLRRLVAATNAYAKRQRTWFRHQLRAAPVPGGKASDMLERALAALREEGRDAAHRA